MLLNSPCLLHYFYHNIRWGVDVHICICIRASHSFCLCAHALHAAAAPHWPVTGPVSHLVSSVCCRVTVGHVTAAVFELRVRFLDISQVRRCWIKIDSAVNLGETESSEFVQCVLWDIRLKKTVQSICCAVRHTVTLPRAVWRTKRSPQSVRVLIATTNGQPRSAPTCSPPVAAASYYC